MKIMYWVLVLAVVAVIGLVDRPTPKIKPLFRDYTVKAIFAGIKSKELANNLAENIISEWPSFQPVVTIAKDGEL